ILFSLYYCFFFFFFFFFFFNDTATTEIYTTRHTLSLHDALPIFPDPAVGLAERAVDVPAVHDDARAEVGEDVGRDDLDGGGRQRAGPSRRARVLRRGEH